MDTPRELSPYGLIQEHLRDDPWRLLVAVIMLNQTSSRQVWPVLPIFFERWPDPECAELADPGEMADLIRSLGLQNRRARTIIGMSRAFLEEWDDVQELPGIGKYGADSFNIFVRGYVLEDVQDKELINYVRWAKAHKALTSLEAHEDDGRERAGGASPDDGG